MKITKITAHLMGVAGSGGNGPCRNWIFVRVETDEGITGIGEATTEWHEYAVAAMIEQHMGPLLVGQDPTKINSAWQRMLRGLHFRGGIKLYGILPAKCTGNPSINFSAGLFVIA